MRIFWARSLVFSFNSETIDSWAEQPFNHCHVKCGSADRVLQPAAEMISTIAYCCSTPSSLHADLTMLSSQQRNLICLLFFCQLLFALLFSQGYFVNWIGYYLLQMELVFIIESMPLFLLVFQRHCERVPVLLFLYLFLQWKYLIKDGGYYYLLFIVIISTIYHYCQYYLLQVKTV